MDTTCPSTLLAGGEGYTLHVHTVGGVDGYNLHIYTAGGGGRDTGHPTCPLSIGQTIERDAPCMSTTAGDVDGYTLHVLNCW
jgi:hypothetical protein